MENEIYKDYQKRKNKISLVMWLMINNNLVTRNIFLIMMVFDFVVNFIIMLCIYSQVNSIPLLSQSLINAFDYNDPTILSIIAIS